MVLMIHCRVEHFGSETELATRTRDQPSQEQILKKALTLCVAYAATCGGISTLTGTGPNLIFKGVVDK